MKTNSIWVVFAFMATLFVAGCVANRLDWNSRIGHFSFDQAIVELGPPDKQAHLSDGRTVAEWITHTQTGGMIYYGGGYRRRYTELEMVQSTPTYFERKFRLVFTPDNLLSGWSQN